MNPIQEIQKEHEDIERELFELETISNMENINYSNLLHVFKKLHNIWNSHEEKEEKIFPILEKREKLIIPVKKTMFEHRDLRKHKEAIENAIKAGSETEMKKALEEHGKVVVEKLRKHINDEDEVLYTIALEELTKEDFKELSFALSK